MKIVKAAIPIGTMRKELPEKGAQFSGAGALRGLPFPYRSAGTDPGSLTTGAAIALNCLLP